MKHCHFTILYNEIDFLRLKMPFLYEHFDQLIFYDLHVFGNERKFSNDGSHEFIKNYPDPDNKITLIEETDLSGVTPLGAGNEIKCKMFSYGSKFVHDDIDVFWCTDMDEFFKEDLIAEVETIFKRSVNSIGTKFYNFYKTPEFLLTNNKELYVNPTPNSSVRIIRHQKGNKYGHCDGAKYRPINLTTKNALYHLSWVGEKRVREKFSYYKDNPVTGFVSVKYIKEWEEFSEAKFNVLNKKGFYGNPFVGPGRFDRTQVTRCPFDLFEELPYLDKEYVQKMISGISSVFTPKPKEEIQEKPIEHKEEKKTFPLKNFIGKIKNHVKDEPKDLSKSLSLIYSVTTYNRLSFLKKTIETWYNTINKKHKWTLIVADDNSDDGTVEYLRNLKLDGIEIIIILNDRRGVHHQTNQLLKISISKEFDVGFKSDDDLVFIKSGWDDLYINAIKQSGYSHLIFYDRNWGVRRNEVRNPIFKDDILQNYVDNVSLQGAFWTFTKDLIKSVGFIDVENFGLCGLGHVDFSLRCCRSGYNDLNYPFDAKDSNEFIQLNKDNYISHNEFRRLWNTEDQLKNKKQLLRKSRFYVAYNEIPTRMNGTKIKQSSPLNDYFDHVYCLNLDRRSDKWETVNQRFLELKINVERFSAVDGNLIPDYVLQQYEKINKYAVGCILSHYKIIEDAKNNKYNRILILEDDVLFIENFNDNFTKFISQIKSDWKLLYLGASQHEWNGINVSRGYYLSKNCDGTFAYAVDHSIYDQILNTNDFKNRPIDNMLHDIQEKNFNKCFTSFPNLIISDVGDSDIRKSRDNETHRVKMRWNLAKYR